MKQYFRAPWGARLKLVTGLYALIVVLVVASAGSEAALALGAIALVAAALMVRGYGVGEGELTIHRLGWATTFDLSKLVHAEVVAGGLPGSLRMFGVGGLFSFVGRFWHPDAGWYRAYATDGARTVFLDLGDERLLVTPDSPHEFAAAVLFESRLERA